MKYIQTNKQKTVLKVTRKKRNAVPQVSCRRFQKTLEQRYDTAKPRVEKVDNKWKAARFGSEYVWMYQA